MANSVADSFWLTVLFFLVHVDRTKNNTDEEGEREREREGRRWKCHSSLALFY